MTYVLDTDVFTLACYGNAGVPARIAVEQVAYVVAISIVTRIEVLLGRYAAIRTAADAARLSVALTGLRRSEACLARFPVLDFNSAAEAAFDRLRVNTKLKMSRFDLLMACVALGHGATLVTRNLKDFAAVPGLLTASWTP